MDLSTQAQTKTIDGVTYRAWPLPFGTSRPLLVRLFKLLAPIFGRMVMDGDGAGLEAAAAAFSEADFAEFGGKFGDASQYIDGANTPLLTPAVQSLHFAGKPDVFIAWLVFCMEVNGFARFFTGNAFADLRAKIDAEIEKMKPTTPTTPTTPPTPKA